MDWAGLGQILQATGLITAGAVLCLWLISIPLRDISIIDMAFASLIAMLLFTAYTLAEARGLVPGLIMLLVAVWALRMTVYLVHRNWGRGEDPRYTRLRGWVDEGLPFYWLSLRQVFLLQGAIIWSLTLPFQIAMLTGGTAGFGVLAAAGVALWSIGFFFEAVGDWQLSRFRANPDNRGKVLNTGLWRYTRHPNYFGELSQWWGLFLIALEAPWAWLGLPGLLLYSWLLVKVTGQATLDKKLSREKPEYAAYMRQTSGLIPRPPRAGNAGGES